MQQAESFDVFLSYSSHDKVVVQALAERLQRDGLKVWFDEWAIRVGDSIPSKIEAGLEHSSRLVFFMSAQAFESDWTQLERHTFHFLDPHNEDRRIISVRLDNAPLPRLLAQFKYVDWREQSEQAYSELLDAFRVPNPSPPQPSNVFKWLDENHFRSRATVHRPQALRLSPYFSDPLNHLHTLRDQLQAQGQTAVLAQANVQGMGGVGKSQLALKYSHVYEKQYNGVWWFSAETEAGLQTDCRLFCEKQGITLAQSETPAAAVQDWLAGQENWLLVYDNAEEVKMVLPLLPASGSHHVLLTSRNPQWDGMAILPLNVWNPEHGAQFLRARLQMPLAGDAELIALSTVLGGLPLALEQACAYIGKTQMTVPDYVSAIAQQDKAIRLLQREDANHCPRSVFAALSLAFGKLSPAAQELLGLCSWLAAEPIPTYLFTEQLAQLPSALQAAAQDELIWPDTLAQLVDYGLCKMAPVVLMDDAGNPGEEVACLTFHRLTQAAARIDVSGRESLLLLTLPDDCSEPINWPRCKTLMPHVLYIHQHYQAQWNVATPANWLTSLIRRVWPTWRVESHGEMHHSGLLLRLARYLQQGPALYQTALPLLQQALAITEKALGSEHPETGGCLHNLAGLLQSMGKYDDALPFYQKSLYIMEKTLGPEHPNTGACLNGLGSLHCAMGEHDKAEALYQRGLVIAEKTFGPAHPITGTSLNNLANYYLGIAKPESALPFFQRALSIAEKAEGLEHPSTAIRLNNLASVYDAIGKYELSLPLYERALAILTKALGPEHPETGKIQNNLVVLYSKLGQFNKALELAQSANAIAEKTLGPEHPETATNLNSLALVYQGMGSFSKALSLFQRALAITAKTHGEEHALMGTRLNNLAGLYCENGEYTEALPLYKQALDLAEKKEGPDHPATGASLNNLGELYRLMGEYDKALPLHHRALAIAKNQLGPDHFTTGMRLSNLAELYKDTGDYHKAATLFQQALDILEKALGPSHPYSRMCRAKLVQTKPR